jgi:hypothetical protein
LLQENTARLPGRVDATDTIFTSSTELAAALRRTLAAPGHDPANLPGVPSSAVVPRHQIQMRPAHFFDVGSRQADVGEQMVIKFEKLPVLVLSIQPQCYCAQPRKRDFPGPSKVRK